MKVKISEDVYKDTLIDVWIEKEPILDSSRDKIKELIKNPIDDINELKQRQKCIKMPDITNQLLYLKTFEDDVKYFLKMNDKEESSDNEFMKILFLNNWYNCIINYTYPTIELFHLYRIYSVPLIQFISPISIILGPYYYLTKVLKLKFTFTKYISIIWKSLKMIVSSSYSNLKSSLMKWISFLIYGFLYVYGLWQVIDLSMSLHRYRNNLCIKIMNVKSFVNVCSKLFLNIPDEYWKCLKKDLYYDKTFIINGDLTDVYNFWIDRSNYKYRMNTIIECINYLDIANVIQKLYKRKDWCLVDYDNNSETIICDMKTPLLDNNQISNPVKLDKHMIITGPNAGGKTTYVKNIVLNVILSQTFGIAMCYSMKTKVYNIIQTFMRVSDEVGTRSFFETEIKYCKNLLDEAEKNKKLEILFVMDEPMHSTPPIEGQSTAYAVCEYINNNYKNAKIIVTTHYHSLINLGYKYNKDFRNLSMEAIENKQDEFSFKFPYRIRNKYSKQCIALELLGREMFPDRLIQSAIEMKNRISKNIVNDINKQYIK